jgi:hypothetical protein
VGSHLSASLSPRWAHVPTAAYPALTARSLASPHAPLHSRVRSRRRSASDRACPSASRRLCLSKCAMPPCLHAEPAALTSLLPPHAPAAGRLTSPPSSRVGRRRAVRARAPPTPTVYPIHASPSTPSNTAPVSNVSPPLRLNRARSQPPPVSMKSSRRRARRASWTAATTVGREATQQWAMGTVAQAGRVGTVQLGRAWIRPSGI